MTGLFAVIWSGDETDQMAVVDRPVKLDVGHQHSKPQLRVWDTGNAIGSNQLAYRPSPVTVAATEAGSPLPSGISPGTYLVVDQHGRTETRVIRHSDVDKRQVMHKISIADHFVIEVGSHRWHYIRLESTARRM
jgi:hypothetical protein